MTSFHPVALQVCNTMHRQAQYHGHVTAKSVVSPIVLFDTGLASHAREACEIALRVFICIAQQRKSPMYQDISKKNPAFAKNIHRMGLA
jgi:hypothetical protein